MDNKLTSFLTVTRLGNLTAAAIELSITQPALTKRLQQLEIEFGAPLLKRHSRGVSLTEQGVQVLYHARRIQSDYLQAFEKVKALQGNQSQTLRIASGPFFLFRHLAQALIDVRTKYPSVHFNIENKPEGGNLERLRIGELDIVFGGIIEANRAIEPFDFEFIPITTVNIGLLIASSSPLTAALSLQPKDLQNVPWIEYSGTPDYGDLAQGFFLRQSLLPPDVIIKTSSFFLGTQVVERSNAVMMAPKELFPAFEHPGLTFVETVPFIGKLETGAFVRTSSLTQDVIMKVISSIASLTVNNEFDR